MKVQGVAIAALTAIALVGASSPAFAAEDPTNTTAAVVNDATPDNTTVATPSAQGDVLTVDTAGTSTTIPVDPNAPLVIDNPSPSVPALSISLPDQADTHDATVAPDGTVVYPGVDGTTSVAVQALGDGTTRIATVIPDASAPMEYTYTLGDGVTPVLRPDGGVDLTIAIEPAVTMVVGSIDTPWATDANGNPVATHYTVTGNQVTQVVNPPGDAVYPIVADPKVTATWWNYTFYFDKRDTATLAAGSGGAAGIVASIPKVGVVLGAYLSVIAGVAGVAHARGACVKLVMYLPPVGTAPVPQIYSGAEAGGYCR